MRFLLIHTPGRDHLKKVLFIIQMYLEKGQKFWKISEFYEGKNVGTLRFKTHSHNAILCKSLSVSVNDRLL